MQDSNKIHIKWVSSVKELIPIYTKKWIIYDNKRFTTSNCIDLLDHFIFSYYTYNKLSITISSKWLKLLYGNQYPLIIKWLINNNIIELHKNYSVGRKSKKYKLTSYITQNGFISNNVKINNKLEIKKAKYKKLNQKIVTTNIDDTVINHLESSLKQININYKCAKEKLLELNLTDNSYKVNSNNIEKINKGHIYSGFDKYGRFHTNWTVLKKEIRKTCVNINGNSITELDIQNSQPFFLLLIMKQQGFIEDQYYKNVLDGSFYDTISNLLNLNRKEVKTEVFKILYGRTRKKLNTIDLAFKTLYPLTWQFLIDYKIKLGYYKLIARQLQMIESNFIFNIIIPEIIKWKKIPIITVHDSIIFEKQYEQYVNNIWNKSLYNVIL